MFLAVWLLGVNYFDPNIVVLDNYNLKFTIVKYSPQN